MKERPEEIQLILDNLGKQLTELRESIGVKRSYIYRNGNLPAGSVISIESAARNSYVKSLFEYLKMVGGYILLKSRDENVDGVEIESIKDISAAFINILHDKKVTHNWLHDKTGIELRVISRAITGSKESNVGMLFLCASVLGFDFFVRKNDRFVLPKKAKKLMINKVLPEYDTKLMTRAEFCEMLKGCRESVKCSKNGLCKRTMFAIDNVGLRRMESADSNFTIDKAISYLEAINFNIQMLYKKNIFVIKNSKQLSEIFKNMRAKQKLTQGDLTSLANMSRTAVRNAEYGETKIPIDVFLKYMQIFGYTIELKKIE